MDLEQEAILPFLSPEAVNASGRLERLPMTSYQRRVFGAVATAWLADQVNVALLVFLVAPIAEAFHLNKFQIGLLASMTFLGQLIGNIIAGLISDRYGRRLAFQVTMLVWGIGSFLAAGATGLITLTRLQQWNPERYDNGTIEDWKITVFSEPFDEFSKT